MIILLGGSFLPVLFTLAVLQINFPSHIVSVNETFTLPINPAPAKRVVVFFIHSLGFRSIFNYLDTFRVDPINPIQSYLHNSYLKYLINNEAAWGISKTSFSIGTRSGHIAAYSGYFETPLQAALKLISPCSKNYDSVLKEVDLGYVYGDEDLVNTFKSCKKFRTTSFVTNNETYYGSIKNSTNNDWIKKAIYNTLFFKKEDILNSKAMFSLHFNSIYTTKMKYGQKSPYYSSAVNQVFENIHQIESFVGRAFPDNRTCFIITSDYGETEWNSDDESVLAETEAAFITWGAGITHFDKGNHIDIKQYDIAVLISTLLGITIPKQSLGVLALPYLNFNQQYKAVAFLTNFRQLYVQLQSLEGNLKSIPIFIPFRPLAGNSVENKLKRIDHLLRQKKEYQAIQEIKRLINTTLDGIKYYESYFNGALSLSVSISYILWTLILLELLLRTVVKQELHVDKAGNLRSWKDNNTTNSICVTIFVFVLLTFYYVLEARLHFIYLLYFILPQFLLLTVLLRRNTWFQLYLTCHYNSVNERWKTYSRVLAYYIIIQLMINSFYDRIYLIIFGIILGCWEFRVSVKNKVPEVLIAQYIVTTLLLSSLVELPFNFSANHSIFFLSLGCSLWIWTSLFLTINNKSIKILLSMQTILILIASVISICLHFISISNQHYMRLNILSWCISGLSLLLPIFGSNLLFDRILHICLGVISPIILLSRTYEPIFMFVFVYHLITWTDVEYCLKRGDNMELSLIQNELRRLTPLKIKNLEFSTTENKLQPNFRRAFFCVFYLILAVFMMKGLGNMRDFSLKPVVCFVSTDNYLTITALHMFKIVAPLFIVMLFYRTINTVLQIQFNYIYPVIMVIMNVMGLHFFNSLNGSESPSADMKMSLQNLVIVELLTMFIFVLYGVVKLCQ